MQFRYYILFCIFYFIKNSVFASAWTRNSNEFYSSLEFLVESNNINTMLEPNEDYFKTNTLKLYFEYGLLEKFTFGGYLKQYDFIIRYRNIIEKVKDDFYGNLFIIQNLYKNNYNVFSLQYSLFFPIIYTDFSKLVNIIDTKKAFEFGLLFGKDGEILLGKYSNNTNLRYYIDSSLNYKFINNAPFDKLTFAATLGLRLNYSSSVNLHYETYLVIEKGDFNKEIYKNNYDYENSHQCKISFNYLFSDNLSVEFGFYQNFSKIDSTGAVFLFIFSE